MSADCRIIDAAQKNYKLYGVFVVVRKYNRIKEGMIPMNKLQYTLKTDTLFKMLFVKHEDLLKKLPNDIKEDNPLLLWLSPFRAETEEELVDQIAQATGLTTAKTEDLR